MSRECQLIMVTENNNNKFYNMYDDGSIIKIEYGRVGASVRTCSKPSRDWDKIYREKTGKGYKDITALKTKVEIKGYKEISDSKVKSIVDFLISKSRQQIANNYKVSYTQVTQAQIDEAQSIIDELAKETKNIGVDKFNNLLLKLYTTIPRKMAHVQDFLLKEDYQQAKQRFVVNEQDLLDNMATQVQQNKITEGNDNNKTILEQIGLMIFPVSDQETIDFVKRKLGKNSNQLKKIYKVVNENTDYNFRTDISCITDTSHYLWHGSRTENWWSILSTGLKIRPSNAVYTGSMFGDGLYFADKAQKSIGYTSLNSSYWARGNDSTAFLALYEVRVGTQKVIQSHTSECYKYNKKYLKEQGYDSVFAKAGSSLINNEYVVYSPQQCTIRYLVEIGN